MHLNIWITFLKLLPFLKERNNNTSILEQIVRETQKWHKHLTRPSCSWVCDQNVKHANVVLIKNSGTIWPTKILMAFLTSSKNLFKFAFFKGPVFTILRLRCSSPVNDFLFHSSQCCPLTVVMRIHSDSCKDFLQNV